MSGVQTAAYGCRPSIGVVPARRYSAAGRTGRHRLAIRYPQRVEAIVFLDAPEAQRPAADQYWQEEVLPWIRQRTAAFRRAAPAARVVELDAPNHLIHIAREDETLQAMIDFLEGYRL